MSYEKYYNIIGRSDLSEKIELIRSSQKETEVGVSEHEVVKVALQAIDHIVGLYLDNLIGDSKDPRRLYEAVLKYMEVDHPGLWLGLIYQRLDNLYKSLIDFELFEMIGKMQVINDTLAGLIRIKDKNIDVEPLIKLENLRKWREVLDFNVR